MEYFIGIDIHKATSHIVVLDGKTDLVVFDKNIRTKKDRFDGELAAFVPAKILIEASTPSRWVSDHFRAQGHEVIVCNPGYALTYASRPANRKNDREDAKALAFACKAGHYKAVHRVSDEHRSIQELLGSRATVIQSRTMFINRVRSLYAGKGLSLPSCDADGFRAAVVRAGVPGVLAPAVTPLLEMLAMVEDQVLAVHRRIAIVAEAHPIARLLMTVPGVGPIVALAFIAAVDTPTRFANAHQLESYLGLVPTLHASAGPGQGGRISKMGATYLRTVLVQAAWSLMRSQDPAALPLQEWANALGQRRNKQLAIVALSRRLAGVLFAIWRDQKPFELKEPKQKHVGAAAKPLVRRYTLRKAAAVATTA